MIKFNCKRCDHIFSGQGPHIRCPKCSSCVEIVVELDKVPQDLKSLVSGRKPGLWKWKELLPEVGTPVSLGEGETPLIHSPRLSAHLGLKNLFFKAEHMLPTGSLKDRSSTLAVTHARTLNAPGIAVTSTGNQAASLSAYAAAGQIPAYIFVPAQTDMNKIHQTLAHGAHVIKVRGSFADANRLMAEASAKYKWYPVAPTNPYRNEGKRTVAYEIWQQLDFHAPDFMVHAIAGGVGLRAAHLGWKDLQQLGYISAVPKMIGVQAEKVAPMARAFASGQAQPSAVEPAPTCAESIAVATVTPDVGFRTLQSIRESGGSCRAYSDEAILEAKEILATKAGLFVEPAAAASLAAIIDMKEANQLTKNDTVICLLTGSGFKQQVEISSKLEFQVEPSLEALESALKLK